MQLLRDAISRGRDALLSVLLAAGSVSYSAGASGMHFVKVLERLGIADAIAAKRVAAENLLDSGFAPE